MATPRVPYQNAMRNSDKQNARIEHDKALERAVKLLSDHTELFEQFLIQEIALGNNSRSDLLKGIATRDNGRRRRHRIPSMSAKQAPLRTLPCRKLDPDVLVVQSTQDWHGQNTADGLDRAVLAQCSGPEASNRSHSRRISSPLWPGSQYRGRGCRR